MIFNKRAVGRLISRSATELTIELNERATPATVENLLRAITFGATRGSVGERTVLFTLTDREGLSVESEVLVSVR